MGESCHVGSSRDICERNVKKVAKSLEVKKIVVPLQSQIKDAVVVKW